ncbi:MAG: FeoB-associated Cys-rich membrane protein [Prevotella sp.]|uniref:FeoB-associated Cys-rich membrane protein n=1 Tax=Prevotella sp. AGR2160 TaxID=1280674 RepID=UPI0012DE41C5|nr:FeoB-associated Cys-rich membrane protein [Prevotella sp. AGR2160]MDD5861319.1 FeoB-associated Cys-rich membrane protein [Prevotella sp.]
MTIQYMIVGIIVALAVIYAGYKAYQEIKENIRYKNYGCAGCPFYEKCSRKKKK